MFEYKVIQLKKNISCGLFNDALLVASKVWASKLGLSFLPSVIFTIKIGYVKCCPLTKQLIQRPYLKGVYIAF